MHTLPEDVRMIVFLGGLLFFIVLSPLIGYIMERRGHSATKAVSFGVTIGVWGAVLDLALTFRTPLWIIIVGLTAFPLAAVWATIDLLATWESTRKRRNT